MNKTTVNETTMQARKIALSGKYDNIPRIIKDIHDIIQKYETFFPTSLEKNGLNGKLVILSLNGHIKVTHSVKKRTCLLNLKVMFPKDYPKSRPIFMSENPNEEMHNINSFYPNNKLARYDRSSDNNRMNLFLEFPEIKVWGTNSSILETLVSIERRFAEHFPWVPKQNVKDYGTKQTYLQSNIHPQLKKELEKVETEIAEFESDFDLLNSLRREMVVRLGAADVGMQELTLKQKELKNNSNYFFQIQQKVDSMHLDESTIDKFIRCLPESQKSLELLAEKDALEECLNYLKQQLKEGVRLAEMKDPLKRVYEDMFTNQVYLNQM